MSQFIQQIYNAAYNNAIYNIKQANAVMPIKAPADARPASGNNFPTAAQTAPGPSLYGRLSSMLGSSDGVGNAVGGALNKAIGRIPNNIMSPAERQQVLGPVSQALGGSAQQISDVVKARALATGKDMQQSTQDTGNAWQRQFPQLKGTGAVPSIAGGLARMIDSGVGPNVATDYKGLMERVLAPRNFTQQRLQRAGAGDPSEGWDPRLLDYINRPARRPAPPEAPLPPRIK